MKKSHAYIIALLIVLAMLTNSVSTAKLEGTAEQSSRFWVVVTENENSVIAPLLDRYIQDIRPILAQQYRDVVVEKKLVVLDQDQSTNRQAYSVATTLENGFHNNRLKGAMLVNMPLPEVMNKGSSQASLLPYGDFENKYFVFNTSNDQFISQEAVVRDTIHPEIVVGYLPDLSLVGFQGYFDANHSYYTHTTTYNKAIFFNDQIDDDDLWTNLDRAVQSPLASEPFNPRSFDDAIKAGEKAWKDALRTTRRWQSLPSLSSSQVRAYFNSWYDEPALSSMSHIMPKVATYFLDLPDTQDPNTLNGQENSMGSFLNQLGVFSSTIAINHRLFAKHPAPQNTNNVCNNINPIPTNAGGNEEIQRIHNQINTLKTWIGNVPRGSLIAKATTANTITVNGMLVGQYFLIRPGALVRTINNEPITVKTILVDPSAVAAELHIPRGGFNHPGLLPGVDGDWHTNNIGDEHINELIAWHYFLNPSDQYLYFSKNRLPPINQYSSLPDTYEIVYNKIAPSLSQYLTAQCLNNRSPETKSLLTIFTGHIGLVPHNEELAVWQELRSGASLASIVLSGQTPSATHSFDDTNNTFTGLKDPLFFSSWAGGSMLGQALLTGLNENVNLLGDPCLILVP